jgi:hypothetical protein
MWLGCYTGVSGYELVAHLECADDGLCQCVEGMGYDLCTIDEDCSTNHAPTADTLVSYADDNYCLYPAGTGGAYLTWYYRDQDGDQESKFELQIAENSNFTSPIVDILFNTSYYTTIYPNNLQIKLITVKTAQTAHCTQFNTTPGEIYPNCPGEYISYGKTYYWRVAVRDSKGAWSGWHNYSYSDGSIKSYVFDLLHPPPAPSFTSVVSMQPDNSSEVKFTDGSRCYGSTFPSCPSTNCDDGHCYTWDFGDGSLPEYAPPGNITKVYDHIPTAGYGVSLRVCDEDDYCCNAVGKVSGKTNQKSVPLWKEIAPF